MPEDIKKEEKKVEEVKDEMGKSAAEITRAFLDGLLKEKKKSLTYAELTAVITDSFTSLEKAINEDKNNPFHKSQLDKYSKEFIVHVLMLDCYAKVLSTLFYLCSPEEAEKIQKLLG